MEYIVAGYNMVTDIYYPDREPVIASPGGSYYAAAGIALWRDSLVYIGTAGPDFGMHYGKYFSQSKIATDISECLPSTLYYTLHYNEDGSWEEACKQGTEYEEFAKKAGQLRPEMFLSHIDSDTKGIYIEASLSARIAGRFDELKRLIPHGKAHVGDQHGRSAR